MNSYDMRRDHAPVMISVKATTGASSSPRPERLSQDQQIADAWGSIYGGASLADMVSRIVTDSGQEIVK